MTQPKPFDMNQLNDLVIRCDLVLESGQSTREASHLLDEIEKTLRELAADKSLHFSPNPGDAHSKEGITTMLETSKNLINKKFFPNQNSIPRYK